jgi:outer membrane lipoprotein-sorting protein
MFSAMLLMTCEICAEPIKSQQPIVPRPLTADYPRGILCLPPASALDAIGVESQIDPGPTSALTALGVDQALIDADPSYPSSVTKEVAEILDKCEAASRQIKTSKVTFNRTVYNLVFEIETRSEGELYFEAPDKQSIDLRATTIPRGMKAARIARGSGRPFRLESGKAKSWILTKDEVAISNDAEKSYARYPRLTHIPEQTSFWFDVFARGHLSFPFLFDIRADQIRTDWDVTVMNRKVDQTILKAIPRTTLLKHSFKECLILIDNKTWQVVAVKHYDCTHNLETVYKLGERVINEPLPADCFDSALKWEGYKEFKFE